jgi:hypothetical protein
MTKAAPRTDRSSSFPEVSKPTPDKQEKNKTSAMIVGRNEMVVL